MAIKWAGWRGLKTAVLLFVCGTAAATVSELAARKMALFFLHDRLASLAELQLERIHSLVLAPRTRTPSILILGDSTAVFSLDAAGLPDTVSLAAVDSTTLEAYEIASRYLENGPPPACALISLSLAWGGHREARWSHTISSGFFSEERIAGLAEELEAAGDFTAGVGLPLFRLRAALYRASLLDATAWPQIRDAMIAGPGDGRRANKMRRRLALQHGSNILDDASSFSGRLGLSYDEEPRLTNLERAYLARLLALLKSRGVETHFVGIPFAQSVPARYGEEYLRSLREQLGSPEHFHEFPSLPEDHFLSAGHLNRAGVRRITPLLADELAGCIRQRG